MSLPIIYGFYSTDSYPSLKVPQGSLDFYPIIYYDYSIKQPEIKG